MARTRTDAELTVPFRFTRRPSPIPTDLRTVWRVALTLLILDKSCRAATATLPQLHVLNWAVRTDDSRAHFRALRAGRLDPRDSVVRFDPTLNRVLDFAIGEGLVERLSEGRVRMTQRGRALAADVERTDCFGPERAFLESIGKTVSAAFVKQLLSKGARE